MSEPMPQFGRLPQEDGNQQAEKVERGAITQADLARELGVSHGTIRNCVRECQQYFPDGIIKKGGNILCTKKLADKIRKKLNVEIPEGAIMQVKLANELGFLPVVIRKRAKKYQQDFPGGIIKIGNRVYYTKLLADKIRNELGVKIPEGAIARVALAEELDCSLSLINKCAKKYQQDFPGGIIMKKGRAYYTEELANKIRAELGVEIPEDAITQKKLARELGVSLKSIRDYARIYQQGSLNRIIRVGRSVYYTKSLANKIRGKLGAKIPGNVIMQIKLARELGVSPGTIVKYIKKYQQDFLGGIIKRGGRVYYTEELADRIREKVSVRNDEILEIEQQKSLKNDLEIELSKIEDGIDDKQLKRVIDCFGGANVVDILFYFYPKFKGLQVDYVRGRLAEYLGDFLVRRREFHLETLKDNVEMLSNAKFEDSVFEVIKRDGLSFYNKQKRGDKTKSEVEIFKIYIKSLVDELGGVSDDFYNIIEKVEKYYNDLLNQKKPGNVVDALRDGRIFPDVNQLINIKEIKDKNRMLIADEMGLGKSASAILSKEYLGCSCALVVVPSNVVAIWREYLSSDVDQRTGKQKGYFKKGLEPRVLIIENRDDIIKIQNEVWDYVIVSHEKMNDIYTNELLGLNNDMLIVDEVHKMKNMKGVRANNLLRLAGKINGTNQYLTLLSGTPVPNKVDDLVMVLKLLYPKEFGIHQMSDGDLVQNIIKGGVLDLRSLLVPRMQMKSVEDSIDMPKLNQKVSYIKMSSAEKDIYEVLLEEDETTASQKLQILRQFSLNPVMIDSTPAVNGSKINYLLNVLQETFNTKNKVIVFVNSYVENIIRGDDSIQKQLERQLEGVNIFSIHGRNESESDLDKSDYRKMVQDRFNNAREKILLLVSGNTADVGVDFSGGEKVFFYNEPWTMYDKRQQLARVFREGIGGDLDVDTLIVEGTIEEGIHKYIRTKEVAIEKLLRGIPTTELEQKRLQRDEQVDMSRGVNEEMAEYYFSSWSKLMKIFGYTKEIGEKEFVKFLTKHGEEYAECYVDLGARSYQANASRVTANIIDSLVQDNDVQVSDLHILDIASGPEMLKKHSLRQYQDRIFSIDINKHHFKHNGENRVLGSFSRLPILDNSMDFVNFSFAIHYSKMLLAERNFERVEVLAEINRVLKEDGCAVINFVYSINFKNKERFLRNIEKMGFEIVSKYTGDVDGGENYKSFVLTIKKKNNFDKSAGEFIDEIGTEDAKGFKFTKGKGIKLKDSRMLIKDIVIGDRKMSIRFNAEDVEIYNEEQFILKQAEMLKGSYNIEDIERRKIIREGFVRIYNGKRYILFKKLKSSNGAVVVRS